MKKGMFRIEITIKTPTVTMTQSFDLADHSSPQEWVKTAKDWIRKEAEE